MPRTSASCGRGWSDHPLRQCLAGDVFQRHEKMFAPALAGHRAQHVWAVNAPGNPFFQQEALQRGFIGLHVNSGGFEHHVLAALLVDGKVDVAAVAGVQLAHDLKAIEDGAWLQQRRQAQVCSPALQCLAGVLGQRVNAQDLHGEVVFAAAAQGLVRRWRGRLRSRSSACSRSASCDEGAAHMLMHAIGDEHESVARIHRHQSGSRGRAAGARRARGSGGCCRPPARTRWSSVSCSSAWPCSAVDAGVADMKQVRGGALEHQGAEGADIAPILVEAVRGCAGSGRAARSWWRPARTAPSTAHAPGFARCSSSPRSKPLHGGGAGDVADLAAADAVGQRHAPRPWRHRASARGARRRRGSPG
ncbi:MAG: hypothetical protein V9G23_15030 [Giesbergeria sp.]